MCLLDARCRCETGQCSHIGPQMSFNNLINPSFFNQENFESAQKLLQQKQELQNLPFKKLKRENDFVQPLDSKQEGFDNSANFPFQTNMMPFLHLQPMKNLDFQNQNNGSFIMNPLPFKPASSGLVAPSSLETSLKDMQARVMGMFAFQSKMLTDLQEKSNLQAQTIGLLLDEVKQLKNYVQNEKNEPQCEQQTQPIYSQIIVSNENCSLGGPISPQGLIQLLFKKKESDYKYRLILNQPLEQPLYRERNFSISVSLVDKNDNPIHNFNRIPLNISIYTSENPSKFIDTNTSGNKILKGFTEKDLQSGQITFDKIQIKEVTSHFRNGWVFLVIFPKALNYECGKILHRKEDIDISEIRPLVIEKVVVKAKKIKDGKRFNKEHSQDESKDHSEKIEEI